MKLCQNVHRVCSVAFSIVFIGCWVKSKNARKMALAVRSIFHTITRATSEYCAYKKVPYHRIIFVYFKLDFHCLCSLQKSSSKQTKNQVQNQVQNQVRKQEISKIKCRSTRGICLFRLVNFFFWLMVVFFFQNVRFVFQISQSPENIPKKLF